MSEINECPGCATKLRLPAGAKKAKCPNCKLIFPASSQSTNDIPNRPANSNLSGQRPAARVSTPAAKAPAAASKATVDNRPQLKCPKCEALMKLPAGSAGQSVRCPNCKTALKVPKAAGAASANRPAAARPIASAPVAPVSSAPPGFESLPAPGFAAGVSSNPNMPAYATAPAMQSQSPYRTPANLPPQQRVGAGDWTDWFLDNDRLLKLFGIASLGSLVLMLIPLVNMLYGLVVILSFIPIQIGCGIGLMLVPFREDTGKGLLYILCPGYAIYYWFVRWDRCKLLVMLSLVSFTAFCFTIAGSLLSQLLWGALLGNFLR